VRTCSSTGWSSLEKLEGLDQQRQVVAVDGAEVLEAELLKEDGGPQHALAASSARRATLIAVLPPKRSMRRVADRAGAVVLVGDDAVEVAGDGADVAVDGPLVVVEDDDHALGLLGDVVERLEGDAVGEGGVAGDGDHVLVPPARSRPRPCPGGGERGAGVARAVAVVLAFGAQHEAVEAAGLADGLKAVEAAGEDLVDVGLVADVEEELVFGRIEKRRAGPG
jgi:hypothetical protein